MKLRNWLLAVPLAWAGCTSSGPAPDSVREEARDLMSLDLETWAHAGRSLVGAGRAAVPPLLALLDHDDERVRERAAYVLGQLGLEAASAADALERTFRICEPYVQPVLVHALKEIEGSERTLALLSRWVDERLADSANVSGELELFIRLGTAALPRLLDLLEHRNSDVRSRADETLRKIPGAPRELLPRVLRIFARPESSPEARLAVIIFLARYGPAAREARPGLLRSLKDQELLFPAAYALWQIEPETLLDEFDRGNLDASTLASAFGQMEAHQPRSMIPRLVRLLGRPEFDLREAAARALCMLGAEEGAEEAVPALLRILGEKGAPWAHAADALGAIGPRAVSASAALAAMARRPGATEALRSSCVEAMAGVGAPLEIALPLFVQMIDDSSVEVRESAVHALWVLGPRARPALPLLEAHATSDLNAGVRFRAKRALERIREEPGSRKDGVRLHWFTTDPLLWTGNAYDRGQLSLSSGTVLVVPEEAQIEEDPRVTEVTVFLRKNLNNVGHPDKPEGPLDARRELGCAWHRDGDAVRLASYGEWSGTEGGMSVQLRIRIPRGVTVRKQASLSGEGSPANNLIDRRAGPAFGWTRIDTTPDEESARAREGE